jgi:hypothetical protein
VDLGAQSFKGIKSTGLMGVVVGAV